MSSPEPAPGRDHILIAGPSKTGTTGLYSTIKDALAQAGFDYVTIFEPRRADVFDSVYLRAPVRPVMTKTTVDRVLRVVPDPNVFERRLTTVRDPRDTLISSLLFRPLTRSALERTDEDGMQRFIDGVRHKEADPSSISVRELFELARAVGIGKPPYRTLLANLAQQRDLIDRHGFHIVRYEDFVTQSHGELGRYLGLEVRGSSASTSSTYGHIARSKESGAFRHWFRRDDLDHYNEMFGEFIDVFAYRRNVELPGEPVLPASTGSTYLLERYAARRQKLLRSAAVRVDLSVARSPDSAVEVDELIDHGDDGDAVACLRLAQIYRGDEFGASNLDLALHWARRSAELGFDRGVEVTIEILEQLDPAEPGLRRELRAWQSVRRSADAVGRVKQLEKQVERQRRSGAMQVGNLMIGAATDPRHKAVPAARELASLWRARRRTKR